MQQLNNLKSSSSKNKIWSLGVLATLVGIGMLLSMACTGLERKDEKPVKQAQWHYEMASGYFESNEIPLAIRELTTALQMDPDHADAHYLLAFIYMGRRSYTQAISHFREALRVQPDFHFAKNNLGSVYLAVSRWDDAAELFQELLEEPLYMTPELAHNNLGWAYYNMRQYNRAAEHLRMAVFLKPEMCLAYNNLGLVLEGMRNPSEAITMYRRAIEFCPGNYQEPHFNLGRLYQTRQDPKATVHFQRCVELQPMSSLADRCREYLRVQ